MDEVSYAGGLHFTGSNNENKSYYLYSGYRYWTMSPFCWNGSGGRAFVSLANGYEADLNTPVNDAQGVRPVINLSTTVAFSSGDGTQNSPYIVAS